MTSTIDFQQAAAEVHAVPCVNDRINVAQYSASRQ